MKAFYNTYVPSELIKESVTRKMLKQFPNLLLHDYTENESVVRQFYFIFYFFYFYLYIFSCKTLKQAFFVKKITLRFNRLRAIGAKGSVVSTNPVGRPKILRSISAPGFAPKKTSLPGISFLQ